MRVGVVAMVEDDKMLLREINKQTRQPDNIMIITDYAPARGIQARRHRIAVNQQMLKRAVNTLNVDMIWQLEQDVILPEDCLERLINDYEALNRPGFVSGIQIGRHGIYCIGAWHLYDDYFISVDPKAKGFVKVNATGLYCLLTSKETWMGATATYNGEPWGPDVNWGVSISKPKYVDMELHIGHRTNYGEIWPDHPPVCQAKFTKQGNGYAFEQF